MEKTKLTNVEFPSTQTAVTFGQVGIKKDNKYFYAMQIANEYIAGNQQNSLLFNILRKKNGYVYGVHSSFNATNYPGPFLISFQTKNENTTSAIQATENALVKLIKTGADSKAINAARNKLINGFYIKMSNNENLLLNATAIALKGRKLDYLNTYQAKMKTISDKQVNAAIKEIIHPKQMNIIVVGKKINNLNNRS